MPNQANVDFIYTTAANYIQTFIEQMQGAPPSPIYVVYAILRAERPSSVIFTVSDLEEASLELSRDYPNIGTYDDWYYAMSEKLLTVITEIPAAKSSIGKILFVAGGILFSIYLLSRQK